MDTRVVYKVFNGITAIANDSTLAGAALAALLIGLVALRYLVCALCCRRRADKPKEA